jgi:hypothetical protein
MNFRLSSETNPLGTSVFLTVEPIENNISQIELTGRLSRANSDYDESCGDERNLGSTRHFDCPRLSYLPTK